MYDFCMTPLFATYLGVAGIVASIHKESFTLIYSGLGIAAVQVAILSRSLSLFQQGIIHTEGIMLELAIAVVVAALCSAQLQYHNYEIWPFGLTAGVAGVFIVYYCWLLIAGPKPKHGQARVGKKD